MSWIKKRNCTDKQQEFLEALTNTGRYAQTPRAAPQVLYGGSGYSGKSRAIRDATYYLNATLAKAGFPGQWGTIACKQHVDLTNRQVEKLMSEPEFKELGNVRMSKKRGFHFEFNHPALGGFYLRHLQDAENLRGVETPWFLVDELTELTLEDREHIMYTLRSPHNVPFVSFGAGSNPDGVGHGWVKALWIEHEYEILGDAFDAGLIHEEDFIFIGAKPQDNPTFNETVESRLRGFSDKMLVKARWEGSWDLTEGSRFSRFQLDSHTFWPSDIPEMFGSDRRDAEPELFFARSGNFEIYGSLDFGTDSKAASAFYLHAVDDKGNIYTFKEMYMQGMWLEQQAAVMRKLVAEYGVVRIYCDPSLKTRESDGLSRFHKFREQGVMLTPGKNNRVEGWATLDALLATEDGKPPRWKVSRACKHLVRDIQSAPRDEKNREDVSSKFKDDHSLDSVRYFLYTRFRAATVVRARPEWGSPAWHKERNKAKRLGIA